MNITSERHIAALTIGHSDQPTWLVFWLFEEAIKNKDIGSEKAQKLLLEERNIQTISKK